MQMHVGARWHVGEIVLRNIGSDTHSAAIDDSRDRHTGPNERPRIDVAVTNLTVEGCAQDAIVDLQR